jgi:hypothetical protein
MWGLLKPFLRRIVPYAARHFVGKLHISHDSIFLCNASEVFSDFFRRRVEIGPVWVGVERVLVAMGWDVASTAWLKSTAVLKKEKNVTRTWISVLPPRTTDTLIFLVYLKINISQSLRYSNA